jgi:hypothetical protein
MAERSVKADQPGLPPEQFDFCRSAPGVKAQRHERFPSLQLPGARAMRNPSLRHHVIGIGVATVLAGCGGSHVPIGATGVQTYSISDPIAMTAPRYAARPTEPDHGRSWMSPDAKRAKKLLYVSDWGTEDVFVYDYKNGALVGKLTGLNSPYGQCVDKKGDVWIVSYGGAVTEYAHGGTKPLKTLTTDEQPVGCSVDPTTGNLAVAGFSSIDVFARGRSEPHVYQSPVCYPFWSPGYDKAGNLYVEALLYGSMKPFGGHSGQYSDPLPCELPRGGTSLRGVQFIGFNVYDPGGVMWDGKYLTFTDQDYMGQGETAIHRVTEDDSGNLTEVGNTILSDDCSGSQPQFPQPFIVGTKNTPDNTTEGNTVVGGIICGNGTAREFDYWKYPAGGDPTFSLQSPPKQPMGESVSIAP